MARQGDRPEGSQAFPHSPHLPPSFFPSSVALPRTAFGTSLLVLLVSNLAVPIPGIMREKTADFGVAQEQMGHLAEEPVSFSRWLAPARLASLPPRLPPSLGRPLHSRRGHRPHRPAPLVPLCDDQHTQRYDITLAKPLPRGSWLRVDSKGESPGMAALPLTSSIWPVSDSNWEDRQARNSFWHFPQNVDKPSQDDLSPGQGTGGTVPRSFRGPLL